MEICKHEFWLKSTNKYLSMFANYVKLWKDLAFIFSLIINLFIFLSFSDKFGDRMSDIRLFENGNYTKKETENIFDIMGIIMATCSILVLIFFLLKNVPLLFKSSWKDPEGYDKIKRGKILKTILFIYKSIRFVYNFLH